MDAFLKMALLDAFVHADLHPGNILVDSPEKLWAELEYFKSLRDRSSLRENCRSCDFRFVCGGCRARAFGYFGDATFPDPGCIRNEQVYYELLKSTEVKPSS
jgi:radical SAM protein with 4Fe4S-binding SPASM domain